MRVIRFVCVWARVRARKRGSRNAAGGQLMPREASVEPASTRMASSGSCGDRAGRTTTPVSFSGGAEQLHRGATAQRRQQHRSGSTPGEWRQARCSKQSGLLMHRER